jgi:hypothetical protein
MPCIDADSATVVVVVTIKSGVVAYSQLPKGQAPPAYVVDNNALTYGKLTTSGNVLPKAFNSNNGGCDFRDPKKV